MTRPEPISVWITEYLAHNTARIADDQRLAHEIAKTIYPRPWGGTFGIRQTAIDHAVAMLRIVDGR